MSGTARHVADRALTWAIPRLLWLARGLARLQLRIRERAVDGPWTTAASLELDEALDLVERLG